MAHKKMSEMTLQELLDYEKYLTEETNNENADDMLALLNELDIHKRNRRIDNERLTRQPIG